MKRSAMAAVALAALLVACDEAPQSATGPGSAPGPARASAGRTLGWISRAQASAASSSSATVFRGVPCGIGGFADFPFLITTQSQATFSSSGNVTLQCHGQLPVGTAPTRIVIFTGFECGLGPAGVTTDSREVVTPSGRINLVCKGNT